MALHLSPSRHRPAHRLGVHRLGDWARGFREALADWRQNLALRRELADLENQRLLDPTLTDVGLSRAQLPVLTESFPKRTRLFTRMLDRLGIDRAHQHRDTLNELATTCATCAETKHCRDWLDSSARTGYDAFCPNAGTLQKLRPEAPDDATVRA
jgi:hypothetical protein